MVYDLRAPGNRKPSMIQRHTPLLVEDERDREAYRLARAYLLKLESLGVTDTVLTQYLTPQLGNSPPTMAHVFFQLVSSAQNRDIMATVIGKSLGDLGRLEPLLDDFSPHSVGDRYASWEALLDQIERDLTPSGRFHSHSPKNYETSGSR